MKVHELKTINLYFQKVWDGKKTFEVRKNDRHFKEGDEVILIEYNPENEYKSGRMILGTITYILSDYQKIESGYVVFSFSIIEKFKMINNLIK